MLVHMFVFINVYLGKMSQSNGPQKNRSSIIDPCVLHYSVVCWQIEPQVRFIVQVSIPMRIISFCMILHAQYTVYIYMFLYYTYSEIFNMNYMKYIMYIIIYRFHVICTRRCTQVLSHGFWRLSDLYAFDTTRCRRGKSTGRVCSLQEMAI